MKIAPSSFDPEVSQTTLDSTGDTIIAYFDGLCEPVNPRGVATYGIVIQKEGKVLFEESGLAFAKPWSMEASNNVAEYSAAIRALEWLKANGFTASPIVLRGDSRLIINQLKGKFKIKAPRLKELHARASKLAKEFKNLGLEWVDRSRNAEADRLSRIAYRKYRIESKRRTVA